MFCSASGMEGGYNIIIILCAYKSKTTFILFNGSSRIRKQDLWWLRDIYLRQHDWLHVVALQRSDTSHCTHGGAHYTDWWHRHICGNNVISWQRRVRNPLSSHRSIHKLSSLCLYSIQRTLSIVEVRVREAQKTVN